MRNILITGITGLLGSTLARSFAGERGIHIIGMSRSKRDDAMMDYVLGGLRRYTMVYGSVADASLVNSIVNEKQIDTIYHFGAQPIVSYAELDPVNTFHSNAVGALNVLEAARKNHVKSILVSSSDKMYGHAPCPYKEDGPAFPREVYSMTKTCCDYITQCYAINYGLPATVFRSCNLFGPGDFNFTRLVPNTIIRALRGEQPYLWSGVAGYVREFIYAPDAIRILRRISDYIYTGEIENPVTVNLGTGASFKVVDFMNMVTKRVNPLLDVEIKEKEFEFKEIPKQWLCLDKLKEIVGDTMVKHAQTNDDINKCIDETVDFYREFY